MGFAVARVVAAAALFLAVGSWPYDYYTLLRWVVSGVSVYGALEAHREKVDGWLWCFGAMALLFNPVAPVHLTKSTWALIDVLAGVVMLVSLRSSVGSAAKPLR